MKLLLIDGHYYVYRSFFAIQSLSNSLGEPTNAIYGFIKTLRRMLKDLSPDLAAVIWDNGMPQRRVDDEPVADFVVTVDEVEARTGLDFFAPLDDAREDAIEADGNPDDGWHVSEKLHPTFAGTPRAIHKRPCN